MEESGLKLLLWEVFLPTQKSAPLLHAKRGGTVAVLLAVLYREPAKTSTPFDRYKRCTVRSNSETWMTHIPIGHPKVTA
jgi:hypothetical protein